MSQVIYKIVNLVNDKFYVGSTINKKVRFREHRKQLRGNRHHCKHLQAAWNKYGEEKFDFRVVEEVPDGQSLKDTEEQWLRQHFGKDYCYNSGAAAVAPWRGVAKEDHPSFGRPKSDAEKEAISAKLKEFYAQDITNHPRFGKKHSPESIQKMIDTRKANGKASGENHYRYGKTVSEETRQKISEAQKGVSKAPRVYTEDGLKRAQENMRRNAKEQKPTDFEAVKAKFPVDILQKYDFTDAVYTGALNRIEKCVCLQHGVFSQYAAQFRKGRGCPQCGAEQRAESKRVQMKQAWSDPEERSKMLESRKSNKLVAPT
jgi:group I intron endonuclease